MRDARDPSQGGHHLSGRRQAWPPAQLSRVRRFGR